MLSNRLSIFDFINSVRWVSELSCATCPSFINHNLRVAYICSKIAELMDLPADRLKVLIQASMIHDIGFVFTRCVCPFNCGLEDIEQLTLFEHSELGAWIAGQMSFLDDPQRISEIIMYHHIDYQEGLSESVPTEAFIIKVANNLDFIQIDYDIPLLFRDEMIQRLKKVKVPPEVRESAVEMVQGAPLYFWSELRQANASVLDYLKNLSRWEEIVLNLDTLQEIGRVLLNLIDFRSPITSTHSTRVAAVASFLNQRLDEPLYIQKISEVAGYLHDIGKLVVPLDILEKPSSLTKREYILVQTHAYYTYLFLKKANIKGRLMNMASFHHERLDGSGYPFGLKKEHLTIPERVMEVADVTAALSESRPYKRALSKKEVLDILKDEVSAGKLCGQLVDMVAREFGNIYDIMEIKAQQKNAEYIELMERHNRKRSEIEILLRNEELSYSF